MAPEVLEGKVYGSSADVWSVGTLYYEMIHGKTPFMAYTNPNKKNRFEDFLS